SPTRAWRCSATGACWEGSMTTRERDGDLYEQLLDACPRWKPPARGRGALVERRWFDIWHQVPLVPQVTGMSCWAAAAAMIVGWRECIYIDAEELAAGMGRWAEFHEGLEPTDIEALAEAWDLIAEPTAKVSVASLRRLLVRYGP